MVPALFIGGHESMTLTDIAAAISHLESWSLAVVTEMVTDTLRTIPARAPTFFGSTAIWGQGGRYYIHKMGPEPDALVLRLFRSHNAPARLLIRAHRLGVRLTFVN
jgi:hypothetical protein